MSLDSSVVWPLILVAGPGPRERGDRWHPRELQRRLVLSVLYSLTPLLGLSLPHLNVCTTPLSAHIIPIGHLCMSEAHLVFTVLLDQSAK